MVQAVVEPQFLLGVATFLFPTRDAHNAATFDPPNLPHYRTHGTGRRGDDERLAGFRVTDVEQASISSKSRHTENAECIGKRTQCRVYFSGSRTIGHGVL